MHFPGFCVTEFLCERRVFTVVDFKVCVKDSNMLSVLFLFAFSNPRLSVFMRFLEKSVDSIAICDTVDVSNTNY